MGPSSTPAPGQYGENSPNAANGGHPTLTFTPNGTGGVNYFANGAPTTREFFQMNGQNPDAIEAAAASAYHAPTTAPGPTAPGGSVLGDATAAKQAALSAAFGQQHQGILDSSNNAIGTSANDYNHGILDFLHSVQLGQQGIDNKQVQAELARRQGTQGILGMVSQGVKSGGVVLANKNASDSSASDAIARAYATLGQRQQSGVNNQYAQDENSLKQSQNEQNYQVSSGKTKLQDSKLQTINNIVTSAQQQLGQLDASIANASLPDRINIEQEKETIRQNAIAQLAAFDAQLNSGVDALHPLDQTGAIGKANELALAGTNPDNPYSYSTQAPAQFQNTGPFASTLPLFTLPNGKKVTA